MRKLSGRLRHQQSHGEVDTEGSWAISYGDMVTLLLTFFIMFFTSDKFIKQNQQKRFHISLNSDSTTEQERKIASFESVSAYPAKEALEKLNGKVYQVGERILIEFPGTSFFASGISDVNKAGISAVDKFYDLYKPFMGQYNLSIRAFTDTRKVKNDGTKRYKDNLELSALRSISVMRELQKKGIPLDQMKLSGYGEMLLTLKDLETIPESKRKPTSLNDLARTIVLVIEPKDGP